MADSSEYGNWRINTQSDRLIDHKHRNIFVVHKVDEPETIGVLKLPKQRQGTAGFVDFETEVKITVELDHPNIVSVLDYDLDTDDPYIVTEYHPGGVLDAASFKKMSSVEQATCFLKVANAQQRLHMHGYSYIDFTQNVLLAEDGVTPVLCDFELCTPLQATADIVFESMALNTYFNVLLDKPNIYGDDLDHELFKRFQLLNNLDDISKDYRLSGDKLEKIIWTP